MTTSPNGSAVPVEELRRAVEDMETATKHQRKCSDAWGAAELAMQRSVTTSSNCHKVLTGMVKKPTVIQMSSIRTVLVQPNGEIIDVEVAK